jgi:hypothetical protein
METNQIKTLVSKYNEGLADPSEVLQLEKLIEIGQVEITELHNLAQMDELILKMNDVTPSMSLDDKFYAALAAEKKANLKAESLNWRELFQWNPRTGFAFALLIIGLVGGYMINYIQPNSDVKELTSEVSQMKEMLMLSMLEKESATDRLKAVSLTSDIDQASQKVTDALIDVLNNDPNVNVRLATLEALQEYARNPEVRVQLVKSIASQDSPLVQMALAELMVALREKSSVNELKKLMEGESTPKEVKQKIKESIDVLI